jgi:small subunit ribosomal protein S8
MSVDTIGNFLAIIRNGIALSKRVVRAPYSRMKYDVAQILKNEGFIRDVVIEDAPAGNFGKVLRVDLKYVGGESVIHDLKRISVPGRRTYRGIKNLSPVIGGLGISILTTSKGVMTDKEAKQRSLGGEVICTVW